MDILPVILSGGSGTRLWPVSRSKSPKQFCDLLDKPLHTLTLERLKKFKPAIKPAIIITSENFRDLTESDIRINKFDISKVIYEPLPKNTAPAIAVLCRYLELTKNENQVVAVFSSDNLILNQTEFESALNVARLSAEQGYIVTLGVKPTKAETGFGYIEVENRAMDTTQATKVLKFHEKPSPERAFEFLRSGHYFWNAGIFIFKVSKMIESFKKHDPEIWSVAENLNQSLDNISDVYKRMKSISIDYSIMEKLSSSELKCVTSDLGWSDLGSWDSLFDLREGFLNKRSENVYQVQGDGNSVFPLDDKVYTFAGIDDVIVVDTADALLVCKKGNSQAVKDIVERVKLKRPKVVQEHIFENRPWGKFEILKDKPYFKSKVVRVDAGQKISYQSHAKRSEHWILVKGEALVIINDKEQVLKCGEHVFIPQGSKHRIINQTQTDLEFVEVQVGSYFGEDDIVRYDDDYGRKQ